MYEPQKLVIQSKKQLEDGLGGFIETLWEDHITAKGYIDMITGTDNNFSVQKAIIEDSSHVAIILDGSLAITDNMRIIDESGRKYSITYVDNPMNINHHLEIYCKFDGVV